MKIVTKVGITLATVAMSIGLLGSPATAKDTSWGGCCSASSGSGGR